MRLVSFDGGRAGVLDGDTVVELAGPEAGMPALVALGIAGIRDAAAACPATARRAKTDVRLDAPVPRPGKVIAAPVNYTDHQLEMQQQYDVSGLGVFLKAPSSVIGPGADIHLPYVDRRFDQEGELAVVIGATAYRVPAARAREVVLGYTCLLDVTMRGGEDRSTRKSFETFTPMGPWIVTADEVPDPGALELRCTVNGVVRQHASTADLIWDVDALVEYVSSVMTLWPGDVISTGTPAGVGPIGSGDRVEVTIGGIGTLAVGVTDAGATTCPTRGAEHGPVAPSRPGPMSRPAVPASHRALLERPLLARLATVRPDGAPQCNPVWFDWDGTHVRLSQEAGTRKVANIRAEPRVSLVVVDPDNPFHYLEVRGTVDALDADADLSFLRSLVERYAPGGGPAFPPNEERLVVRIRPTAFVREKGRGGGGG